MHGEPLRPPEGVKREHAICKSMQVMLDALRCNALSEFADIAYSIP